LGDGAPQELINDRAGADAGGDVAPQLGSDRSIFLELDEAGSRERGPGRPRGSKNKSTQALRDYLASKYRDPLDGLGEIVSLPIPEIARLLKCKRLDAAAFWLAAVKEFGPYWHQKQPQAVQFDPGGAIPLVVNIGLIQQLGIDPKEHGLDLQLITAPHEQNQGVSTLPAAQSDADSRTEGAK